MSILINLEKLLSGKFIEGTRVEFKEGWNPTAIMRTVCAFANDFENEGSGYIVIGVSEKDGKPIRPVKGFDPNLFEKVQKEMIGFCNLIEPPYMPRLYLEEIDDKFVLVIWSPAGSLRPYRVPDDILSKHKNYNYRIRQYSSSIIPNAEQESELIQLTAKIPFDDRVNTSASVSDLSFGLMREYLDKTQSKLFNESISMSLEELAEKMNLCQGSHEHLFPKNIGLLMFSDKIEKYFKKARIDVVEFPDGLAGDEFKETIFKGSIQKQLVDVISYFNTHIITKKVIKHSGRPEAENVFNYPIEAFEEALSNAVYHKNYELEIPIEVRVLPKSIEIISFNGADPSLKQEHFDKGKIRIRRYRNSRIGDYLKELDLTEGRGTGIPTMKRKLKQNGSPEPLFDTNEPERTCFVTEIVIHPAFENDKKESLEVNKRFKDLGLAKSQEKILYLIEQNSKVSKKDMSESIGISTVAIDNNLKILKDKKLIKRKDGTRGYWKITVKK